MSAMPDVMQSRTCDRDLAGELRAIIGTVTQRSDERVVNLLAGGSIVRPRHGELAGGGCALERYRILLGECEVDEVARIVDVELKLLRLHRRLQRQHEI